MYKISHIWLFSEEIGYFMQPGTKVGLVTLSPSLLTKQIGVPAVSVLDQRKQNKTAQQYLFTWTLDLIGTCFGAFIEMAFLPRGNRKAKDLSRSNWDNRFILSQKELLDVESHDVTDQIKYYPRLRPRNKDKVQPRHPNTGTCKNKFLGWEIEKRRDRMKASEELVIKYRVSQDKKRDVWIYVNRVRRILFGQSFDNRVFKGYSRMEVMNPWLSKIQKARIVDIFKAYHKKV